jgi:WD40 repeat protein
MSQHAGISIVLAGFLLGGVMPWQARLDSHPTAAKELEVLQISAFTDRFPAAFVKSFDLSPDGKTVAVEFETYEGEGNRGIWIALWSLNERAELRRFERLEGPGRDILRDNSYQFRVRFGPDGQMLFVLTGPRLVALALPTLEVSYAIEAPVPPGRRGKGPYIHDFSIALEVERIAIHYQSGLYPDPDTLEIQILDSKTGELKVRWSRPGYFASFALSPDGSLLAAASNPIKRGLRVPDKPNAFVFDSSTGKQLRAINTGFMLRHVYFMPDGNRLLTCAGDSGFADDFKNDAIKIWDLQEGKLAQKLSYGEFGIRGQAAISASGTRLVTITEWQNPDDRRQDRDVIRGFARFLIWDLEKPKLEFISAPLQGGIESPVSEGRFLVRLSADGKRLVVGGERISLYSVEQAVR